MPLKSDYTTEDSRNQSTTHKRNTKVLVMSKLVSQQQSQQTSPRTLNPVGGGGGSSTLGEGSKLTKKKRKKKTVFSQQSPNGTAVGTEVEVGGGVATGWGNSEDEDAASFDSYEEDTHQQ